MLRIGLSVITLLISLSALAVPGETAQRFKLDPGHTQVLFKINHLGFSYTYGMFSDIKGEFSIDDKDVGKSQVAVEIATASINTLNKDRDDHLRKADFFDAKKFKSITFKSTKVGKSGENQYEVTGDLSLHGVTKPITFVFNRLKTGKDPWGKMRTGGMATFTLKRTDFGMNYMAKPGGLGDEVEVTLALEGVM
ncbi:MAG: polyisoprenoid-binding protein [Bdellovibrionaceae bacterium]|nr:polyisoprenoid-binding protein [Bdellovibrionales bacterium]MCB9083372.1 polyisoprenoid-binding protein [Pseudobdellovibrionaceae bacterium]